MGNESCSVLSCERLVCAKGYCKAHHNRWLRYGDVRAGIPIGVKTPRNPDGKCAVEGCDRPQRGREWCTLHYERWQNFGDVQADLPNKNGRGYINDQGYRLIWVNRQQRPEHRVVMEKIIGRSLTDNENVHHKNGQRADNRPENLELWVESQPTGQHVEDLVSWAWEIIDRYDPSHGK